MRGKSLLNENVIIILSLNQSECRKLLRSASSRIGFSLDTGIEESACNSSCMPTVIVGYSQEVIQVPIQSLFSPRKTMATHTMRSTLILRTSGFKEKTLMLERTDDIVPLLVNFVIKAEGKWRL